MTNSRKIDDLDLLALADGLLDDDPARKTDVEAAVAECSQAASRLSAYRAQNAALRGAYAGALADPVPERLRAIVDGADRTRRQPVLRAAAAGLMIVAAGLGGWMAGNKEDDPAQRALLDESYRQFVLHGPGQSLAGNAFTGSPEQAINWIDDEVSIRLAAPDLSTEGFSLIGKRGVQESEDQFVALEYMSKDGRAFTLFMAPRWADRSGPIVDLERHGVSLSYWHDGPLAASIATHLPQEQARVLALSVRRAMRDDTTAPAAIEPEFRTFEDPLQDVMADSLGFSPGGPSHDTVRGLAPAAVGSN